MTESSSTAAKQPLSGQALALANAISPKILSLTILPTEKCNFRCTYCYETFEIGRMSPATVAAVKALIASRVDDLHYLNLSWFGGEPLAAPDIVLDISRFAMERSQEREVHFSGSEITTNGSLLTLDLLRKLIEVRQQSFQISLDGWREGHDHTRRSGSGDGTFDLIWSNLLAMRDSDLPFHVTLRIHLTSSNVASVERLAREIVATFGADPRFSTFLKPIANLGGPNAGAIEVMSREQRQQTVSDLNQILSALKGNATTADALLGSGTYICYASKPNSLIIRANGQLAKCTVAFEDDRNNVGRVKSDGTLEIDNPKLGYWFRGLYSRDKDVLACPVQVYPHEERFAEEQGKKKKKVIALAPV